MYDLGTRKRALALVAQGAQPELRQQADGHLPLHAIRSWQARLEPLARTTDCPRCAPDRAADELRAYAYLLGLYLGDGCISPALASIGYYLMHPCADAWPGLIDACRERHARRRPGNSVCRVRRPGLRRR